VELPIQGKEGLVLQSISYDQLTDFRKSLPFLKESKG
jgi:hypothetical protein